MKRIAIIALLLLVPAISACNTIQGVGKDITAVGRGMQDSTR